MKLFKYSITDERFQYISITEINDDGSIHKRSLVPNMTLKDDEYPEVKALAEEKWTAKIKSDYAKYKSDISKRFKNDDEE